MKVLIFVLLLVYLPINNYFQDKVNSTIVEFKKGNKKAIFQATVLPGRENVYLLNVEKGQKIKINITSISDSLGSAVFDIKDPNGKPLPDAEFDAYLDFTGRLKKKGIYKIIVFPVGVDTRYYQPQPAKYKLVIKSY